ncbi:nitroreductase [Humitalea rosea]|uniref:Nitroreductase n=1 Tax=Humitalea rosea TaxID=990373 RepID=A0A2W7J1H2_9PROT|nr:nitroreductase [Humitalea rosea]PZW44823.1 nitroreductase [Humitalea rosea]
MTATADVTALEHVLRERHSCRGFLPDPLDDAVIERILGMAQRAPSWCNAQPWRVTITRGAATEQFRTALRAHMHDTGSAPDIAFPAAYRGIYQERRRTCGYQLYDAVGVAHGDREASARQARENFRLFGAPHVAIVSSDAALGAYGAVDCGAFVTCFMLAAQALGVASIAQAALTAFSPFLHGHFGIPEDRSIVCGISFGYEDTAHPANRFRTSRAPLEEVLAWQG